MSADYSPCRGWPHACFRCKFAILEDVYFCRAYNQRHFGQDRVKVELLSDRSPWWIRERRRRAR